MGKISSDKLKLPERNDTVNIVKGPSKYHRYNSHDPVQSKKINVTKK